MSFCEHCEGQRFDRAQVLRALRATRRDLRAKRCGRRVDEAMVAAINVLRALEIPHLERAGDYMDDGVVH